MEYYKISNKSEESEGAFIGFRYEIETKYKIFSRHRSPENLIYKIIKYRPTTYNDKNCNRVHLMRAKTRSFNGLLNILKTYYPDKTEKDLINILLSIYRKHKDLHGYFCPNVTKIVFSLWPDTQYEEYRLKEFPLLSTYNHWGTKDLMNRGIKYSINSLIKLSKEE